MAGSTSSRRCSTFTLFTNKNPFFFLSIGYFQVHDVKNSFDRIFFLDIRSIQLETWRFFAVHIGTKFAYYCAFILGSVFVSSIAEKTPVALSNQATIDFKDQNDGCDTETMPFFLLSPYFDLCFSEEPLIISFHVEPNSS